jgi:glycosyltransferase involved in cell wall biosynthesis
MNLSEFENLALSISEITGKKDFRISSENDKQFFMRHDVDSSIYGAAVFAESLNKLGIRSNFFIRTNANLYNPLNKNIQDQIRFIAENHNVGLHIESPHSFLSEELFNKEFQISIGLLNSILRRNIDCISWHRPHQLDLGGPDQILGLTNLYSKRFFKDFVYISDSGNKWSAERKSLLFETLLKKLPLQLLIHPEWWLESGFRASFEESIRPQFLEQFKDTQNKFTVDIPELNLEKLREAAVNNDQPLISIVISTIGRPNLRKLINDIFHDLYGINFEIVIVKDGEQIFDYEPSVEQKEKIKIIKNENRLGPSSSFQIGIDAAKGEFVRIFPDDDDWAFGFVESAFRDSKPGVILTGTFLIKDELGTGRRSVQKNLNVEGPLKSVYNNTVAWKRNPTFLALPAMLIPREIFDQVKFYPGLFNKEDIILLQEIWEKGFRFKTIDRNAMTGNVSLKRSSDRATLDEEFRFCEYINNTDPDLLKKYIYRNLARPHVAYVNFSWLTTVFRLSKKYGVKPNPYELINLSVYFFIGLSSPLLRMRSKLFKFKSFNFRK